MAWGARNLISTQSSTLATRVHGHQGLLRAPVKFRIMGPLERVDHRRDARFLPLTHKIKVQHALDGPRLQPVDDAPVLSENCVWLMASSDSDLWGNQPVRRSGESCSTPSSRRRVDGVNVP